MATTSLPSVTLRALTDQPATPIPQWVGGQPTTTESIPEAYVQRLTLWAALSGYDPATTVVISHHQVRSVGEPGHLPEPFHPQRYLGDELTLPTIASTSGGRSILGWGLVLTQPGRDAVDVVLLDGGVVRQIGTKRHRKADADALAEARVEASRNARREDGLGPLDDVARATRRRAAADKESAGAEEAWREAIRAAVAAHEAAGRRARFTITDLARNAGISRERVYQIRDGRR